MKTKDFNYYLPEELIAQHPLKNRVESRLLIYKKLDGEIKHESFKDIINYINSGDTLVLNNTKVMPARIYGTREGKDEKIEFLLIKEVEKDLWEVIVRPGRKVRPGRVIYFGDTLLAAKVIDITDTGTRLVKFSYEGDFYEVLDKIGEMPLPPYIKETLEDRDRYQTVYSKHIGSAAAPTAGLHFTDRLLEDLKDKGVNIVYITLHVGLGTFSPVRVDSIEEHMMHSEYYSIDQETADIINETKSRGGKVISVGTTSTRTLESVADESGKIRAKSGWTDIFIYPGYKFKIIDGMITNFHLPESTLLMLVSALVSREEILKVYKVAIEERYRFFSFGDAMLII